MASSIHKHYAKNKLQDVNIEDVANQLTIENVKKRVKKAKKDFPTTKVIIFIIVIAISVFIALEEIITSITAAVAGCLSLPVTFGAGAVISSSVELGDLVISELIQDIVVSLATTFMGGATTKQKILSILIIGITTIIDLIISAVAIFIPCIGDVVEVISDIISQIIQNAVLLFSFFTLFN